MWFQSEQPDNIRDDSCILIISRQDNALLRIIEVHFDSPQEIDRFVKECEQRYGISQIVYGDKL